MAASGLSGRLRRTPKVLRVRLMAASGLSALPLRLALLGEGAHSLAEVLGPEGRQPQLDQLPLVLLGVTARRDQSTDDLLVASHRDRCVRGDLARELDGGVLDLAIRDDLVHEPDPLGVLGVEVSPDEEQLSCPRRADRVDELLEARVAVDQPKLGGRHPDLHARGGESQVAAEGELEPTAERVAVERRDGRERKRLDRLDRAVEGVRHQSLRLLREYLVRNASDVVAGGEDLAYPGHDHAARLYTTVEPRHRAGEGVEDVVVERVALV